MTFFERLKLAWLFLIGRQPLPGQPNPVAALQASAPVAPPVQLTPEQLHASALFFLGLLQREGRLLDFLQEDIAQVADGDLGAAARVVHDGCRKVLKQYVPVSPVMLEAEGAQVSLATGFDANRFRLTGNVTGTGPWKGALKHHGWVVDSVQLPALPSAVDVKVIAPAEIELA